MQMHFYVMLSSDMKEIKKDALRDMSEKLKLWKHKLKHSLNIQCGDTPVTVRAKAGYIL
jgi:UV DNA damage repair endonuclease